MTREQIRQCADIVRETVSARDYAALIGLPINRSGFAQCPFHSGDRTGSLMLYKGTRGWHCFGCGASGDVIELAKRYYGLTFTQAIVKVSQDAGVQIPMDGQVTVDQAKVFHEARQKREQRERQERISEQVDDQYYDTLGDYIEISREFDRLDETISQQLKEHPIDLTAENPTVPDDDLMDEFFKTFAAKTAVTAALHKLENRRV